MTFSISTALPGNTWRTTTVPVHLRKQGLLGG